MKRILLLSLAMLLSATSESWGAISAGDDVQLLTGVNSTAQSGSGGGGPFLAKIYEDTNTPGVSAHAVNSEFASFYTFCVQHSEGLTEWNNLQSLATTTLATTNRFLTGYAAWAYQKFTLDNTVLANIGNTTAGVGTVSSKLIGYQKAIWAGMVNGPLDANAYLQVGTGSSDFNTGTGRFGLDTDQNVMDAGVTWTAFLQSNWGTYSSGITDLTGDAALKVQYLGTAQVMNLTDSSGNPTQDQIIVNAGSLGVPEPASLAVWSILAGGAAGLSVARRRRGTARGRWSNDNREAILSVIEGKHGH